MTRIRTSAPIDPNDRFTQQIKALQEQVAELQRPRRQLPLGEIAYAQVTADQGSITSVTDLTGLSVTFTAISGRKYRVTGSVWFYSSVDGDSARMSITDGSNNVLQSANRSKIGAASTTGDATERSVRLTGLSGSTTIKLRAQRTAGTGNVTAAASATAPAFILVEDIGSA